MNLKIGYTSDPLTALRLGQEPWHLDAQGEEGAVIGQGSSWEGGGRDPPSPSGHSGPTAREWQGETGRASALGCSSAPQLLRLPMGSLRGGQVS